MNSITDIIPKVASKAQRKFLAILFSTIMVICGKVNFTNLRRYSEINERTYRRQFSRSYNFIKGNVTDCSFVPKSGKATYRIEYFYNGSVERTEKGLEISCRY
ncbi:hypothetical protein B9G53_05550 [Pseudanabaena sp. SR411]|nr:hypothetical protein B9G53_05550 [Pseudanabaena sp. SR411]